MISTCNFAIIESAEFIVFVIDDIPMNDLPTFTARDFNPGYISCGDISFLRSKVKVQVFTEIRLFLYIELRTLDTAC